MSVWLGVSGMCNQAENGETLSTLSDARNAPLLTVNTRCFSFNGDASGDPHKAVHSNIFKMCTNTHRYIVFAQKNLNTSVFFGISEVN